MGWWTDLWKKDADKWVFRRLSPSEHLQQLSGNSLVVDNSYVELYLESFWLPAVRKGWKTFYGSVHSWVRVSPSIEMLASLTPGELKNADASSFPNYIALGEKLLNAVPYRGPLSMEIGLFAVRSRDLLEEFLGVLEGLSKAAGQSYHSVAKPFIAPIKSGLECFAGMKDSTLEIGVYGSRDLEPGYFVAIRATSDSLGDGPLTLNQSGELTAGGTSLKQYPYLIIKLDAVAHRDVSAIPDIKEAYESLHGEVKAGDLEATRESFGVFRRVVFMSEDLILVHKQKVVQDTAEQVNLAFGSQVIAAPSLDIARVDIAADVESRRGLPGLDTIMLN